MSTARPFCFNSGTTISGTIQIGNIAISTGVTDFSTAHWYNGADEDPGYIICGEYPKPNDWYGIEYDTTSTSPTLTRIASDMTLHSTLPCHNLLKACLLNDDLSVNYYLCPNDWSKKLDGSASNLDGTDGQVMIRKTASIYWKFETEGNINRVKCSTHPIYDFVPLESPIWNLGAFEATLQRSSSKLSSVVNTSTDYRGGNNNSVYDTSGNTFLGKPATTISRTNFRTYARNRGFGWNQLTYDCYKELFWLFAIEYATFNSQLPVNNTLTAEGYKQGGLGPGVTTAVSSEWNTYNGYYPFINCGASNSLASGSGEVSIDVLNFGGVGVTRTFKCNRYRGVENPFGHIWKWIDGVNIYAHNAFVIENPMNFADDTSTNARSVGIMPENNYWIQGILFGNKGDILPSLTGGSSSTYMCDYYYTTTSLTTWYALLVSGSAANGTEAGVLCTATHAAASATAMYIGGRLHARSQNSYYTNYPTDWYGIEYDTTVASPTVTRIGSNMTLHHSLPVQNTLKACLINDDKSINYYLNPTDWSKKLDDTASNLDGTDGQVMIRKTAKTYWKFEEDGNIRRVKCSLYPMPGYTEVPIWCVGAYEASLQRSTSKLASVINTSTDYRGGNNTSAWDAASNSLLGKPVTNISRTNFRTYARNRGNGWNQLPYDAYNELVWMFIIEYATFNSQLAVNANLTVDGYKQGGLGNGVTTINSTEWSNFNGYNPFINCGASNSLASGTGEVNVNVTNFGGTGVTRTVTVNRYRGIENIFGHIWKWVDGFNMQNYVCYVINNPDNFADDTATNATNAGTIVSSSGWIKKLINGEIIPSTVGGDNTTYMCDYTYVGMTAGTWYALLVSGGANYGTAAGVLYTDANAAASYTTTYIGGRLHVR